MDNQQDNRTIKIIKNKKKSEINNKKKKIHITK